MAGVPTPENVLGGYLIAIILSVLLYGISIAQAYVYWLNSDKDKFYLKAIVGIVMFLETIHSIFTIHMAYHYTITCFGELAEVNNIIWSSGVCVCSGLLVILFVQLFYLRRIWILSKKNIVLVIIPSIVLVLRVGVGYATAGLTWKLKTWPRFRHDTGPLTTLASGIALSTAMDLLVALILIYFLAQSRTGFRETDHVIQRLMAYAVNTGALTMIVQLAVVFVFVFKDDSLFFAGLWLMTSKLYANSLLGTLNARQVLRQKNHELKPSELRFRSASSQMRPIEVYQESSKVTDVEISYDPSNEEASETQSKPGLVV